MRDCPVCGGERRNELFAMEYNAPDGWSLPKEIIWYECTACGMVYGDGVMNQEMFNEYYRTRYGYGINNPQNIRRLEADAEQIIHNFDTSSRVVDFGGAGDDGESILVRVLKDYAFTRSYCIGAGDDIPQCDVLYASHVIEHIYDLPATMERINEALGASGTLIIDVPDSTGLLERWRMPILDYNTKHLNHFTLRTLLHLGWMWGWESVKVRQYELENAPAYQVHFKRIHMGRDSAAHVERNISQRVSELLKVNTPVNVWGLGDITWHLLAQVDLKVIDYIDNDPAMRGQTFKGQPILEKPTNYMPILIMAQGQRGRLIENIRKAGIKNRIIEI